MDADAEQCAIEYATTRDPIVRDKAIEKHMWLSEVIARRMWSRHEPLEDLIQVCNVGLLEALDRFDPSYGVAFRTFAERTMRGVVRHHYRTTWRLKVPRRVQERAVQIRRLIPSMAIELGHTPALDELAERVGCTTDQVLEAMDAEENFWPLSLSYLQEELGDKFEPTSPVIDAEAPLEVHLMMSHLSWRQRRVLYLHFYEGMTLTEIAKDLGLSRMTIFRTMKAALEVCRQLREVQ